MGRRLFGSHPVSAPRPTFAHRRLRPPLSRSCSFPLFSPLFPSFPLFALFFSFLFPFWVSSFLQAAPRAAVHVCRFVVFPVEAPALCSAFVAAASCALLPAPFGPCRLAVALRKAKRSPSPALLGSSPALRSIGKRRDARSSVRPDGGMRARFPPVRRIFWRFIRRFLGAAPAIWE